MKRRGFLRGAAAVGTAGLVGTGAVTVWSAAATPPALPGPEKWMSGLPDGVGLQQLTLPGTHDSAARHGGPWAECQNTSLDAQLSSGIRFLDIRCRLFEGAFTIHHGAFYQHLNFDDVLGSCRRFLRARPSETVLMRVKQEYSEESPERFREIFDGYLDGRNRWRSLFHLERSLPRLGAARGKVVLLGDSDGLPGVRYGNAGLFDIQDEYMVGPEHKLELVEEQFRQAVKEPGKLFTNYVSTAALRPPRLTSDWLNPRVKKLLGGAEGREWKGLGIVPMDFPNENGMAAALIRHNTALAA
ncbi:phosphatidylinositol-specific phospholipase C [Streptomyces sp. ODS28]|uniref:phosphatidylinositol-specific phospholipase C n=1 Tax=Streptomyces sp. ODS28 TaxID=3136688 RepID=UPI0031E8DF4D